MYLAIDTSTDNAGLAIIKEGQIKRPSGPLRDELNTCTPTMPR